MQLKSPTFHKCAPLRGILPSLTTFLQKHFFQTHIITMKYSHENSKFFFIFLIIHSTLKTLFQNILFSKKGLKHALNIILPLGNMMEEHWDSNGYAQMSSYLHYYVVIDNIFKGL